MSISIVMKFVGQYDTYRDMQKRAERKVGNFALCYTKKYGGYSHFSYDGRRWQVIRISEEKHLFSDDGKCIVTDMLRVVGKGWVLPKDETLQERMCRYCDMAGYEYRQEGKAIEYDTPSGITVTIYPWPIRLSGYSRHRDLYGHLDRHGRWGVKYIDEPEAKYLYDLIGKKMEELEQNKNE